MKINGLIVLTFVSLVLSITTISCGKSEKSSSGSSASQSPSNTFEGNWKNSAGDTLVISALGDSYPGYSHQINYVVNLPQNKENGSEPCNQTDANTLTCSSMLGNPDTVIFNPANSTVTLTLAHENAQIVYSKAS